MRVKNACFISIISSVCFVFCCFSTVPLSASASEPSPRLVVPSAVFDFDVVNQGTVLKHDFELANTGKAPLIIRKIHPACGCTAAVIESDTIAPGGKTRIQVTFNTSGFRGYKVKTVRLYTNDPRQTSKVLTLRGTIKADVEIDPLRLDFGKLKLGVTSSKEAKVSVEENSLIELIKIESRSEKVKLSVEDWSGSGRKGKKVLVTLSDSIPLGRFRVLLVVHTSSKVNPVVSIPILAHVEGDLQLSPNALAFGLLNGPLVRPVSETARLSNRGDKKVHITAIESDNPAVVGEFSPIEDGRAYEVRVKIKEKTVGIVRARLKISTDHSKQEQRELILPVYAIISRDGDKGGKT